MNKLYLQYDTLLQEEFKLGRLNLLFMFQVNCPGCFFYGFPVINELYLKHRGNISFLGLSTAFEDFELNTHANTSLLLKEKKLIGETKKYFKEYGFDNYSQKIDFPIAMDILKTPAEFITKKNVESICYLNPNYTTWPDFEQEAMQENVTRYLVRNPKIPITFTMNQFRGTPTFVLFDKQYNVLEHWFGHKKQDEVNEILHKWL